MKSRYYSTRFHQLLVILPLFLLAAYPNQVDKVASALQDTVYEENFEDGQAQGWQLEPGWQVTVDGNNQVLAGQGHVWARSNQSYGGDHRVSFRLKLLQGRIHLVYRMNDSGRYFIGFAADGSDLNKQYWPDEFHHGLAASNTRHSLNAWHQVEIVGEGGALKFFVDGVQEWTYTDPQPLEFGSFAFETLDNSQAYVDDIVVTVETESPSAPSGATAPPASSLTWVRLGGPLGGLGYDIRMRPDNPDSMYVSDAWAGVHKSTDGGMTWFTLNDGIDARTGPSGDAIPVFCLTIDPNNYDIIWIGLQNLGMVYRSMDGGQTWEKRINGIAERDGLTFRGITVEPGNSDVVYAAGEVSSWAGGRPERRGREFDKTEGVVYKTVDGGNSWKAIWRGQNLARYVWINPNDHNILYVSTGIFDRESANSDAGTNTAGGEGILKSTDGGVTWANINNGLGNLYVGSLFMHPQNPDILLAATGNNAYPAGGGVYLTTDGGASWKHVTGEHVTSVEFALSDPNIAYAAGDGQFYRSEDGGETWKTFVNKRGWGWGPQGIRPGFPIDFQVDPRDPYRIFVNNYGGGNFLSEDGGETWVSASVGYTGADLRDVFVVPDNPAFVLVNGRSGPFLSRDGGVNWQGINPLEVRDIAEGARITVDPSNPEHVLLSSAHWGWTYESVNGGSNWYLATDYGGELQNLSEPDTNKKFQGFQAIAFAPSDPKIVYGGFGVWRCATSGDPNMCSARTIVSVLVSEDGGHSWTRLNGTPLDGLTVTEIIVHPENPNTAWVSTMGGGIFRTEDRGQSWLAVNQGLGAMEVMELAGDPTNPAILYAAANHRGVFKSEDGGGTWRQVSAGMDSNEPVYALIVDPRRSNVIYAGSYRSGVFMSEDGGAHWRSINNGLRTRAVTALSISADGETLYAGTTGEGVFRLSTHGQDYFNALAPTPTPIPPTAAPLPAATPTPTPAPASPPGNLPCGGALLLPVLLTGIAWLLRYK